MPSFACHFGPIHTWTVQVAGGDYGLVQQQDHATTIYIHRPVVTIPLGISDIFVTQFFAILLVLYCYFWKRGAVTRSGDLGIAKGAPGAGVDGG